MPMINAINASRHLCPWNRPHSCDGAKCMAWEWADGGTERSTTFADSATLPDPPAGSGWVPIGPNTKRYGGLLGQDWVRNVEPSRGRCGRVAAVDDGMVEF